MSSTQSSRFSDEEYRNWLKTAESLYILRNHIQDFIENETETYHTALGNKQPLSGRTCEKNCENKKSLCPLCEDWKKEIVANYNGGFKNIHWENCKPYLWTTKKWEVAKAYMPGGHKQHCEFAQFDIAALLNLMTGCKHFSKFLEKEEIVKNVINVRNQVMHSPSFKMNSEDMTNYLERVFKFAKMLEPEVQTLKDLKVEIVQFNNILDKNFNQAQSELNGQQEDLQKVKDFQKVLDSEQQALKEKIEILISRFGENLDKNEKPEDMTALLDFLDQNKDLLENLGPEVDKLKEMKTKLDQHDEQINSLTNRVDQLEKGKQETPGQSSGPVTEYRKFLKENTSWLVQSVKHIDQILDDLGLQDESTANVRAESTPQNRMRKLLQYVNCERIAKNLFNALLKYEEGPMEELLGSKAL